MKASIETNAFEMAPAGLLGARIKEIIDIGTQESQYGDKRQIIVTFELPDDHKADGTPQSINKFYNLSLNEKANLCIDIESIAGKKMNDEEKRTFDFKRLLGIACMINVQHSLRADGKTKASITSITPVPKGMTVSPLVGPKVFFDLDDPASRQQYQTLPEWQQKFVAKSAEFMGQAPKANVMQSREPAPMATDFDDELPFN